jgi:hypothetical protein
MQDHHFCPARGGWNATFRSSWTDSDFTAMAFHHNTDCDSDRIGDQPNQVNADAPLVRKLII